MYVTFEQLFPKDLGRPRRSLLRPEIMFQLDWADRFDFPRQELQTHNGKRRGYDCLVVATGCMPTPERIEGLKEISDHFYQYQSARRLTERLASLESGQVSITVNFLRTLNMPHQRGIAPVETILMLDGYLCYRGVHGRVEIVYTYPTTTQLLHNRLFLQRPTCGILPGPFEQRGIRFQRGLTLTRVGPERRIACSEEGDKQPFSLLMAIPPTYTMGAVGGYGLSQAAADEDWLPASHEALQVYDIDRAYTLGDAIGLSVSEADGTCHNQVPVAIGSTTVEARLGKLCAIYDGQIRAVAQVGPNTGAPFWYNYRHDVKLAPLAKLGELLRRGFNHGLYWAVARGML